MINQQISVYLKDEAQTSRLAGQLARLLHPGLVLYLSGNLGSGKTTLVRGVLRALGFGGPVKSPTYTLVEPYDIAGLQLYHFDFYRFNDPMEWEEAGFREYFRADTLCLAEWPEMAHDVLPPADILLQLAVQGTGRQLTLVAQTAAGQRLLSALAAPAAPADA